MQAMAEPLSPAGLGIFGGRSVTGEDRIAFPEGFECLGTDRSSASGPSLTFQLSYLIVVRLGASGLEIDNGTTG